MKEKGIVLLIVLVIGSVIFFFALQDATQKQGSGDMHEMMAIRGVWEAQETIGNYLIFVSVIFGVNFLLFKTHQIYISKSNIQFKAQISRA